MRRSKHVVPYGSHVGEGSFPSCSRLFSPRLSLVISARYRQRRICPKEMQPMYCEKAYELSGKDISKSFTKIN
ncbi:hypothetical protein THF1C08_60153 [Vibrio jasicida]|nr:hypothetical protein THF1C08_60153 [Vibrio jasicida]